MRCCGGGGVGSCGAAVAMLRLRLSPRPTWLWWPYCSSSLALTIVSSSPLIVSLNLVFFYG
uniref:Uncharacterized protein n=1 Tax=Arundo donax TaxID=35708 RepID=A0A0A9EAN4_ARUDO